jgi:hypothetical protein
VGAGHVVVGMTTRWTGVTRQGESSALKPLFSLPSEQGNRNAVVEQGLEQCLLQILVSLVGEVGAS